uniref:secretory phospholipase A2 receptor-like isoform X1 n=1 Tax=Gasterosteus aculeatus aculeatus TaxID=481459 RepID=UPI001A9929BE|nr:secretory phospholipase A2 receptor-like isoform X1 [Gasterosteus aculeatus aculeatus]
MSRKPADEAEGVIEDNEYVNAPVRPEDKAPPDRRLLFSSPSLPLLAVCWILLLLIMGLRIYFSSVISEQNVKLIKENQQLMKENQQLMKEIQELSTEGKNTELKNVIQELKTENQELKENFTKQITDLEDNWEKFNVSRAQWTIDSYCPADTSKVRTCSACQKGWNETQKSCIVLHNSEAPPHLKTWEEARENCRGRGADLVVVHDEEEKNVIDAKITHIPVSKGYWMGLRVEGGTWKWIDGTNLTDASWIGPPAEGHCAVSLPTRKWTSVKCDEKRTRICSQKALSV